jgi:L-lactate dehydrogenase complex protein LldE
MDTLYPQTGLSVVRVLERAGAKVEFPAGQTCCGQPAFNGGMRAQARQMAIHTIQVFEDAPGPVVVPSGSCAAMLRHSYLELFSGDELWYPRAKALAARTYEFSEYLVDVLGIVDLGARYDGKITYHSSCHLLREIGVDRQPRQLIQAIQGAEFVELPGTAECCGFGGVFSVEHAEVSAAMLDKKISHFIATEAPLVVSCDGGCVTHINGGLHRRGMSQRAVHIEDVLDQTQ